MSDVPMAFAGLSAGYGAKRILDDVTLAVQPGAVYALLGRNGEGKTTAVRCLLGLVRPAAGRALLFGRDAWSHRADAMARIGVVGEEPDAPPSMSADELARFSAHLYPRFDRRAFDARLRRLGVPARVPFGRLSKGQKAQLALALAVCAPVEALVLDDPTLGLDAIARRELLAELVGELADRGTTTLITTHDLAGIEGVASHVGILRDGRLVVNDDIETVKATFRLVRVGGGARVAGPDLAPFRTMSVKIGAFGIEAILGRYREDAFERWRRGAGLVDVDVAAMSLEEIFAAVAAEGGQA
jgi:ABC-type multidrug transport system ATPase subunit